MYLSQNIFSNCLKWEYAIISAFANLIYTISKAQSNQVFFLRIILTCLLKISVRTLMSLGHGNGHGWSKWKCYIPGNHQFPGLLSGLVRVWNHIVDKKVYIVFIILKEYFVVIVSQLEIKETKTWFWIYRFIFLDLVNVFYNEILN